MIEQPTGARGIDAREDFGLCRNRGAEPAQQGRAAVDAGQRVVLRHLKVAAPALRRSGFRAPWHRPATATRDCARMRLARTWRGSPAPGPPIGRPWRPCRGRDRPIAGRRRHRAGRWRWRGRRRPGPGRPRRPTAWRRRWRPSDPRCPDHEMPPARMERHLEAGIGLARRRDDEICGLAKPAKIDAEMREPVLEPDRQQPMRALPHRVRTQKREGGSRFRLLGHGVRPVGQFLSRERPTVSARSCGLGACGA